NSHDLNTAYTCDRYDEEILPAIQAIKITKTEWRIVVHLIAELLSYADDLARKLMHIQTKSEETVDRVSLYLTPLAFGAPTGGCAPCSNIENAFGALLYLNLLMYRSSETAYRLPPLLKEKEDEYLAAMAETNKFIDSIDNALQGETMGMHKVRIVSLSPKAVSEQDGIVEVPEETDFSGITSLNKTVPFKILSLERGDLLGNCILSI
ncbi:hypothetical protein Tsp_13494, partial [Trichinella spiralis]|uniref:hypothetical protein n=1 Tax=Trichinella spiralis TaxID=6334 RepID=UPI0001EFED77